MDQFTDTLNSMLVSVFNKILRYEEEFLQNGLAKGMTIREMHLIEYVGKAGAEGRTLSEIADFLEVARPSVTVAVRKLEGKGLLTKSGWAPDGRVVRVALTRDGRKIHMHHMRFHALLVSELEGCFSEDEKAVLNNALSKLDDFFSRRIEDTK